MKSTLTRNKVAEEPVGLKATTTYVHALAKADDDDFEDFDELEPPKKFTKKKKSDDDDFEEFDDDFDFDDLDDFDDEEDDDDY